MSVPAAESRFTPHLSVDPITWLFQAIEQANPKLLQSLSYANVTPGTPTPMTSPVSGGVNTSIVLTPVVGGGFIDAATVCYPRVDVSEAASAAGVTPLIDLSVHPLTGWNDVIQVLNAQYGFKFSSRDLPTETFNLGFPLPSSLTFTVNPASYLYIGALTIALQGSELPMPNEGWVTYDAGAVVFQAGEATATFQGQPASITGLFSDNILAIFAQGGLDFTVTTPCVVEGLPSDKDLSWLVANLGGQAQSTLGFNAFTGGGQPEYDGSFISLIDHTGAIMASGTVRDLASNDVTMVAGQSYAIAFSACVPEWKLISNDWATQQAAVRFELGDAGTGSPWPMKRSITRSAEGNAPDGFVIVGYTGVFLTGSGGHFTTAGPDHPLIDAIVFQEDNPTVDPPVVNAAKRLVINFMDPPDLMPQQLPGNEEAAAAFPYAPSHAFDNRRAKIIDSRGNIFWQGRLGDVSETAQWNTVDGHSAFYIDPTLVAKEGAMYDQLPETNNVYALVIEAPAADVPMSTFSHTALGGLYPPYQAE